MLYITVQIRFKHLTFQDSGLSNWLGNELKVFADNEPWVMNLIFTFIITAATGVTSNTAMATLLMPILSSVVSRYLLQEMTFVTRLLRITDGGSLPKLMQLESLLLKDLPIYIFVFCDIYV